MPTKYPHTGFHFAVYFAGLGLKPAYNNARFQSVTGLKVTNTPEDYKEGGENRFTHKLPQRPTFNNLILKRGLFKDKTLYSWCKNSIMSMKVEPIDLIVSLLDEKHLPVMSWLVVHAKPVGWEVSTFDAAKSDVLVETLELSYHYFDRIPLQ